MKFEELKLNDKIQKALDKNGFTEPTEIQHKAILTLLKNKNIFGKSGTGTGKTASFVLPILHKIDVALKSPQAIVVAPTRELALQIIDQIRKFSLYMEGISVTSVIGGTRMDDQIRKIKNSQIIVGTPGRINDHLNRKTLKLKDIKLLTLDEADEMLKMGFKNEIDAIFEALEQEVLISFFSATCTQKILTVAEEYMGNFEFIEIDNVIKVNKNINNIFIFTKGIKKDELLINFLKKEKPKKVIIFTNTKNNTDKIFRHLKINNIKSLVINGDKRQNQRTKTIKMFKNNEINILIGTDVVSRGIDVDNVDWVINYDISIENEHFIHRIGRTGRNGKTGSSISFVQNRSVLNQLRDIQKKYSIRVDEIAIEEYGLIKEEEKKFFKSRNQNNVDKKSSYNSIKNVKNKSINNKKHYKDGNLSNNKTKNVKKYTK